MVFLFDCWNSHHPMMHRERQGVVVSCRLTLDTPQGPSVSRFTNTPTVTLASQHQEFREPNFGTYCYCVWFVIGTLKLNSSTLTTNSLILPYCKYLWPWRYLSWSINGVLFTVSQLCFFSSPFSLDFSSVKIDHRCSIPLKAALSYKLWLLIFFMSFETFQ